MECYRTLYSSGQQRDALLSGLGMRHKVGRPYLQPRGRCSSCGKRLVEQFVKVQHEVFAFRAFLGIDHIAALIKAKGFEPLLNGDV